MNTSSNSTSLLPCLFRASGFILGATLAGCAATSLRQTSRELDRVPVIDAATDVNAPRPVEKIAPRYPYKMASLGCETQLRVRCLVDERGSVQEAEAVDPSAADYPFAEAAVEAAKKWRFAPGTRRGLPAAMWVTIPFEFELIPDGPPPLSAHDTCVRRVSCPERASAIPAQDSAFKRIFASTTDLATT